MPLTTILCMVGAASISAFPLFSGFVSKSMVMSAALSEGYREIWLVLLFASAGVFHHAGIKIPYFAFFAHDSGLRTSEPPFNMLAAMTVAALLCIGIGCFPQHLYSILPFDTGYWPFDATHVIAQVQILFFSALAFVWLQLYGVYPPELRSVNLDAEWTYRRFVPDLWLSVLGGVRLRANQMLQFSSRVLGWLHDQILASHGPGGGLSRSWSTGNMILWVLLLLSVYLLFNFT